MSITRQKFVEVALMRLRAEVLEHKTIIDAYLESPLSSIKDEVYFNDVVEHAKAMAVAEHTHRVMTNTYAPLPEVAAPTPPPDAPPITEKDLAVRSPTFRKSQKAKKKKAEK